jgi:hypothetical protein
MTVELNQTEVFLGIFKNLERINNRLDLLEPMFEELRKLETIEKKVERVFMALSKNVQDLVDTTGTLTVALNTFLTNEAGVQAAAIQAAIDAEDTDPALVSALQTLKSDAQAIQDANSRAAGAVKAVDPNASVPATATQP